MSDSETPGDGEQRNSAEPPELDPTQLIDEQPEPVEPPLLIVSPTPPTGIPVPPPQGTWDATTQMPSTLPGQGSAVPPGLPPETTYQDPFADPGDEPPWYQRPGPLAILLVALLGIGGIIAWWLLSGSDDDIASADSTLMTIEVLDQLDVPVDTEILIDVRGPDDDPASYEWLRPSDGVPGTPVGADTGIDGLVAFEWAIDTTVVDTDSWSASVSMTQTLEEGSTLADSVYECGLRRNNVPDTVITMNATIVEGDAESEQVVEYTFPNDRFLAGDTVACVIGTDRTADDSTTVAPSTVVDTTLPPTTLADTTLPPTTVPTATTTIPGTTTTAATTTTTSTTTSTTSTTTTTTTAPPIITVPPQPEATLWDIIDNSPDLSELKALIQRAGLVGVFDDPDATLTLLAPTNQAISNAEAGIGAPDFSDPDVAEAVLLSHVDNSAVLLSSQLLSLDPPEFVAVNPGPHDIDADASPPTVGGADLVLVDVEAANGVLHVIDRLLLPETLP